MSNSQLASQLANLQGKFNQSANHQKSQHQPGRLIALDADDELGNESKAAENAGDIAENSSENAEVKATAHIADLTKHNLEDVEDDMENEMEMETGTETETENETETETSSDMLTPFASRISQEITLVVFPEEVDATSLLPGLNYDCPFSRKGGTLRTLVESLLTPLKAMNEQNILLLGDAKNAAAALRPIYEQINQVAFQALQAAGSQEPQLAEADGEYDQNAISVPVDERIYIEGGNVNLTFFAPYPDLQSAAGVKQIDNLAIWMSKVKTPDVKINVVFAYGVQDLMDSEANLVLNTIAQNEKLNAQIFLAQNHNFDFHPELVAELTDTFAAFLVVSTN
jgi:hypothetical protein